jgi:hypothetical protein
MSYAEAKQIVLLRQELRACWERQDRACGLAVLNRLVDAAGDDRELAAEARRWAFRFAA